MLCNSDSRFLTFECNAKNYAIAILLSLLVAQKALQKVFFVHPDTVSEWTVKIFWRFFLSFVIQKASEQDRTDSLHTSKNISVKIVLQDTTGHVCGRWNSLLTETSIRSIRKGTRGCQKFRKKLARRWRKIQCSKVKTEINWVEK